MALDPKGREAHFQDFAYVLVRDWALRGTTGAKRKEG